MSQVPPLSEAFNAMVATMAAGLPDSAVARFDGVKHSALCGDVETAKRLLAWEAATREAIGASHSSPGDRATVRAMQGAVNRRYGSDAVTRGWCAVLWLHFIDATECARKLEARVVPSREDYARAMEVAP